MPRGSCLCGDVAFELTGTLTSIELCHCDKCKKAYGAPFAATLYGKKTGFRWLWGEEQVVSYDAPLEDAPPAYRHSFCSRCGSPLPLVWSALPIVEVPATSLDASPPKLPPIRCSRASASAGSSRPRACRGTNGRRRCARRWCRRSCRTQATTPVAWRTAWATASGRSVGSMWLASGTGSNALWGATRAR